MGRGRDKTIQSSDLQNMSPREQAAVNAIIKNRGIVPKFKVRGTAVVRASGTLKTRYGEGATPGNYNED